MTAADLAQRNRENAQRSTGPCTPQGKALVARNARKHGATARPDSTAVARLFGIILDMPGLALDDVDLGNESMRLAFFLAEAEVRLAHAERVLDEILSRRLQDVLEDEAGAGIGGDDAPAPSAPPLGKTASTGAHTGGEAVLGFARPHVREDRARLARRYVAEARASRKKAFAAWIAYLQREDRHPRGRRRRAV